MPTVNPTRAPTAAPTAVPTPGITLPIVAPKPAYFAVVPAISRFWADLNFFCLCASNSVDLVASSVIAICSSKAPAAASALLWNTPKLCSAAIPTIAPIPPPAANLPKPLPRPPNLPAIPPPLPKMLAAIPPLLPAKAAPLLSILPTLVFLPPARLESFLMFFISPAFRFPNISCRPSPPPPPTS